MYAGMLGTIRYTSHHYQLPYFVQHWTLLHVLVEPMIRVKKSN